MVESEYRALDSEVLSNLYRVTSLKLRRAEHLGLIMYRLGTDESYIEKSRPSMNLRSNNKKKNLQYKRQYERYRISPLSRGITLWDMIPGAVPKSKTKVKFKVWIKPNLMTLTMPVPR